MWQEWLQIKRMTTERYKELKRRHDKEEQETGVTPVWSLSKQRVDVGWWIGEAWEELQKSRLQKFTTGAWRPTGLTSNIDGSEDAEVVRGRTCFERAFKFGGKTQKSLSRLHRLLDIADLGPLKKDESKSNINSNVNTNLNRNANTNLNKNLNKNLNSNSNSDNDNTNDNSNDKKDSDVKMGNVASGIDDEEDDEEEEDENEWENRMVQELRDIGSSPSPAAMRVASRLDQSNRMQNGLQDINENENLDDMAIDNVWIGGANAATMQELAAHHAKREDERREELIDEELMARSQRLREIHLLQSQDSQTNNSSQASIVGNLNFSKCNENSNISSNASIGDLSMASFGGINQNKSNNNSNSTNDKDLAAILSGNPNASASSTSSLPRDMVNDFNQMDMSGLKFNVAPGQSLSTPARTAPRDSSRNRPRTMARRAPRRSSRSRSRSRTRSMSGSSNSRRRGSAASSGYGTYSGDEYTSDDESDSESEDSDDDDDDDSDAGTSTINATGSSSDEPIRNKPLTGKALEEWKLMCKEREKTKRSKS